MKLGESVHATLHLGDLVEALPFYQILGFHVVRRESEPAHSALLSDGVILLLLVESEAPFQGLTYYTSNLAERVGHLERSGIAVTVEKTPGGPDSAVFFDPNGCAIHLVAGDPAGIPRPQGESFSECGKFGEYSIPTQDLQTSLSFWENLGFTHTGGDEAEPYPWGILMDGLITVGLHQTEDFKDIMISYFAPDMTGRIERLKAAGVPFVWEQKNEDGQSIYGRIQAPGGQGFFLFLGEI